MSCYAQPEPAIDGVRDLRSPARRLADALVTLSTESLARPDTPTVAGERPHVSVTIGLDVLRDAHRGFGILSTGTAIAPESARRIACDAGIIPILLGSQSEPLDIGRATRAIPPAIRRAVVTRDRGCVHPGCSRAAPGCEVHHVQHWAHGGRTALDNLALLCPRHHWTVHHEAWRITFLSGIPHVIPPVIVDPHQRPRRNTMHDLPDG